MVNTMININIPKNHSYNDQLLKAAKVGNSVYENQLKKIKNLPANRKHFSIIKNIFITYWDSFCKLPKVQGRIRPAIFENVDKLINCKNFKNGYLFYDCPNCDNIHIQGFSCKSRFCPSCDNKYREQRTIEISKKCINKPHRQFVLTISDELRDYFRKYRKLYDILFTSADEAFNYLLKGKSKIAKKEKRSFGYVSFLHTFGRDIDHNPHLHILICEAVMDKYNTLSSYSYFNYESLRKSFMKQLLDNIYDYFKVFQPHERKKFYDLKSHLYKQHKDGFYTHGPKLKQNTRVSIKNVTKYIARYVAHPAISESRITNVDYINHTVTYFYVPHEDDHIEYLKLKKGRQYVTESVYAFIEKLIIHIPDKNFHVIRYFGFYSNRTTMDSSVFDSLYAKTEIIILKAKSRWVNHLLSEFKFNPLLCHCGSKMTLNLDLSFFPTFYGGG